MSFLSPTRDKLFRTLVLFSILPCALFSRRIPAAWDLLDLGDLGGALIYGLMGVPIRLLDKATGSAFAPRSEAFIVFPSLPQVAFALLCDAILFYVLACAWAGWRRRRTVDG